MMRLSHILALLTATLVTLPSAAQMAGGELSLESFMQLVRENHPVARQAALRPEVGKANERMARGAFDPKVWMQVDQKYFDDKQYYSLLEGGLKVPTWFGIELMSGFEQNEGVYLDPENATPGSGLWYTGIAVPLGQGLFIDERRAALRQAKLYASATEEERRQIMNQLMYDAGSDWWKWFKAYNALEVYRQALDLAQVRFDAVVSAATLGDRPYLDTLEAGIQVQNRRILLQEAELDYANATARLAVHLWAQGLVPLELADGTRPPSLSDLALTSMPDPEVLRNDSLSYTHPSMALMRNKIDRMQIERRWRAEQLKPRIDLQYKPITESVGGDPLAGYSRGDYTWGLGFSMPLLLRKERGYLRMTDLYISDAMFEMNMKLADINYKIIQYLNEWRTTTQQVELSLRMVNDLASLLDGERQLFNNGESSLFLVNARETGFISGQIQLIDFRARNGISALGADHAAGLLGDKR